MEKVVMIILLIAIGAIGARAQKNSLLVYGNAGYSSTNDASYSNAYSFRPGVGYQFADHLTAGVNIGAWGNKDEHAGMPGSYVRTHSFEAGPFFRYTQPFGSIFAIYGQCDVNYQHSTTNDDASQAMSTRNGLVSRVWPAIGINIKNGFALNFKFGEISYAYSKMKGGGSSSAFLADFNWTTGFQFGISKNFSFHGQ
jgi:hypothetical protein